MDVDATPIGDSGRKSDDNPREEENGDNEPHSQPKQVSFPRCISPILSSHLPRFEKNGANGGESNTMGEEIDPGNLPAISGTVIYRHPHPVEVVACSNLESTSNLWVASGNRIGQIALLDVNYHEESSSSLVQWAHSSRVTALDMSVELVASAGSDGSLNIWDSRLQFHAFQIGSNRDGLSKEYSSGAPFELGVCSSLHFLSTSASPSILVGTTTGNTYQFDLRHTASPLAQYAVQSRSPMSLFALLTFCLVAGRQSNCPHYFRTPYQALYCCFG